jgi:hypothetical protein
MKKRQIPVILFTLVISVFLISWGVTGHRTIGKIAENHLSGKAKAAIRELLGGETLADVSTWADEVRSQPDYKQTGPWHFLNLPLGLSYPEFQKQVEGMTEANVYSAVLKNEQDLASKNTTRAQKIEALKFIVHFVGDLHQPMHISRAEDKGGNTIQLNYEGKGMNLHSLWDTYLLEHQGHSYEQLAEKYDQVTPKQVKQWQSDPLMKWIWESYEISSQLYAEVDAMKGRSIDETYYKAHIGIIEGRIQQAGIRLAGLLNELFKNGPAGDNPANVSSPGGSPVPATTEGKTTTVCDKVYSTKLLESSGMVFLNLGGDYPNQKLSVVIKGKNRSKFDVSPEIAFKDKTICVTGVIIDYNGKPEIIVTDPEQIKVK